LPGWRRLGTRKSRAPSGEEAVLEAGILGIFEIAEDRQRQLGRRTEHLDPCREDLDRTGRQVGVLGAGETGLDLAVDAHDPFRAQRLGIGKGRRIGIDHHLRHAVMVAQVDEEHAAMVADAVAPAGQADILADVAVTERATGMGTIAMQGHGSVFRKCVGGRRRAPAAA
jgi:hypothetical protein